MTPRAEVYNCINHELAYAQYRWKQSCEKAGIEYRPDNTKTVEEWLSFIMGYFADAIRAVSHEAGYTEALHCVRKLAGLTFACLLAHGAARRQIPGKEIVTPLELIGPITIEQVRELVDGEREYQDQLGPDRTWGHDHTVPGYLVMFDRYLRNAIDAWTDNAGDRAALIQIRKLAGIAVHCMEDHGALYRQ